MPAVLRAALGSLLFLVVAPGVVAGLIPWWLTGWHVNRYFLPLQLLGALLIVAAVAALLLAFARFVVEGLGTPAPIAPTERLVVGGAYRYVRNPMYVSVGAIIAGQAIAFGQPLLVGYLVLFAAAVALFVYAYEEPTLAERYGQQYDEYRRNVPAWLPRLTPWRPPSPGE